MKKILSLLILNIVFFQLYSQEMQPLEFKPVKTDYLAKSNKQRTAGWILTGTGAGLTGTWLMLEMADLAEEASLAIASLMFGVSDTQETHSKNRSALLITGSAMMVSGITFLSIAKKNKRKALSMSFINEPAQQLRYNTVMNSSVPSVRLRLQF